MNYGKKFETKFREDWIKTVKDSAIVRLYDTVGGYSAISNISDFICYSYPYLFFIECKAYKGSSIPIADIRQYDKLLEMSSVPGVYCAVVLWLYEKDKVLYIPIATITKLKEKDEKSVGLRHLDDFNIVDIPSVKKRVFMDSDYSAIIDVVEKGLI